MSRNPNDLRGKTIEEATRFVEEMNLKLLVIAEDGKKKINSPRVSSVDEKPIEVEVVDGKVSKVVSSVFTPHMEVNA